MEENARKKIDFQKLKRWYGKYERYLIPAALVAGLTSDIIMFRYINLRMAFSVLFGHLVFSLATITFMHLYDAHWSDAKSRIRYLRLFSPLVLQYTFGALLSGFFIFYGLGGVFSASWPFVIIIVFLMLSNDLLKKYYLHLPVQIGVSFFILF